MTYKKASPHIWLCNKPVGKTPLEAVLELKRQRPHLAKLSITYAGRLDPMAEGLLLLLTGQKVHDKTKYLALDKTYKVTVLLGLATDSGDLLGIPERWRSQKAFTRQELLPTLQSLTGQLELPLPAFSSPPVAGKPLFWHAKNRTKNLTVPLRSSRIYSIGILRLGKISAANILARVVFYIPKVKGDFRQKEILSAWQKKLSDKLTFFQTINFTITCSSGTYIRAFATELGRKLNTPSCVYTLKRTKIGKYEMESSQ